MSAFAEEIYQAPKSWAEKAYAKLIFYNKHDKGTHFAAWEQPELLVTDLRAAFKTLPIKNREFSGSMDMYVATRQRLGKLAGFDVTFGINATRWSRPSASSNAIADQNAETRQSTRKQISALTTRLTNSQWTRA